MVKAARCSLFAAVLCFAPISACLLAQEATSRRTLADIVVTTSILECAVKDVAGDAVRVWRLIPPQSCPGHFDVTPDDLERIAGAALFIRHDYQGYLDAKLTGAGKRPARSVSVPSAGAQTIPDNYVEMCRCVREALSNLLPAQADLFAKRLESTAARVREVEAELQPRCQRMLCGKVVVASRLQAEFCRWTGLEVAATFDEADQASLAGIADAVRLGRARKAKAVVCNAQRGLREGQALAERLGVPVVVLSNFPDADGGYLKLLRANVEALCATLGNE